MHRLVLIAMAATLAAAFEFPIGAHRVTRSYFERSSRVEADPKVAADMRAVAAATPGATAAARLAAAQPYFNAQMR